MAGKRRYDEAEIEQILDLAVSTREPREPATGSGEAGLTLEEIQEIGEQAGIDPQRIAGAAGALEAREELLPWRAFVGMPVSMNRVVELPRALTDREWEAVVSDLRDTFASFGEVGSQGGAREWAAGSLRVLLEPAESGQRLRFSARNDRLRFLGGVGLLEVMTGLVFLMVLVPALLASGLTIEAITSLIPSFLVLGAGAAFVAWTRVSLPRWARDKQSQMDQVAERTLALLTLPRQDASDGEE